MATKFDINNMSRLGDDNCSVEQLNQGNEQISNYIIPKFENNINPSRSKFFDSVQQPGVFQTGNFSGYPTAMEGGSELRNGKYGNILTERQVRETANKYLPPKESPFFLGPPSMAVGRNIAFNPDKMSKLVGGEMSRDRTSVRGKSVDRFVPLVPELESQIQNPKNLIPKYWVRGGMDTRAVIRNIDYLKTCGVKK